MDRLRRLIRRGMIDAVPFYGMMARRRLLTLCVILTVAFLLYSGPSMFRFVRRKAPFMMDASLNSMLIHLEDLEREAGSFDVQLERSFDPEDVPLSPFVGNGYIAFNDNSDRLSLFGDQGRLLPQALPFSPVVRVRSDKNSITGHSTRALHFVFGKLMKVESHKTTLSRNTLTVRQELFAHRSEPSVFMQSIAITNEGSAETVEVTIQQRLDKLGQDVRTKKLGSHDRGEYVQLSGTLSSGQKFVVYSVILPKIGGKLSVSTRSATTLEAMTIVRYSKAVGPAEVAKVEAAMNDLAKADFDRLTAKDLKLIKAEHLNAWQNIWRSGLSISLSHAENALNGDRINATLYYLLSHTPKSQQDKPDLPSLGKHCYKGHHTLNARTLWPPLADLGKSSAFEPTMHLWVLTLIKRGCGDLLSHGGPEGAMQAMLMSFGAFVFHEGHLEFSTLPADLHRDFHYRGLMLFTPGARLNVTVTVNEDNKATLAVHASADESVFACDGGCLDPPVPINNLQAPVVFPVKLTDPPTAVLYVARSQRHLSELKDTLHVHEVVEAPAHEKHVIALHRHGHQLGGLPALFWATFAFLVVVFHLFLARIIYNEYFAKGQYSALDTNNKKYVA